MKKNLIRIALVGITFFLFHSCRTEDELTSSTQETLPLFETFTSRNSESVNYPHGYRALLEKYDSIHNVIHTRKAFVKNRKTGKVTSAEYIELGIRSQEIMMKDNSERWILYPTVEGRNVTGIAVGILKNRETSLEFWRLHPEDGYYKEIITMFQLAYTQKLGEGSANRGGNCGHEGEEPCDTGEVVITVPKPGGPKGDPNLYLPGANPGSGDPGVIGGGCGMYGDCGGGGTEPDTGNNTDPCAKMKSQNTDPNFKAKVSKLESNLGLKKETGYVEKTNGNFEYKDNASATEDTNSLTLGDPTPDMKGYMHTHPNDFEDSDGNMRIGFKIFSPADVIYFNQMIANANQNGIPLGDIYAVMVSGKGNYQIRFTGNVNQIKTAYTNTKDEYNKMYLKYFQENNKRSDEVNFLKFMEEHMYVKGVTLVKMEANGAPTKKTLNSTKTGVTDDPCPQ